MNRDKNGIALILVLGILAVLATLATTFAFNMRLEQKAARNYLDAVTADCVARAGVEYAIALLRDDFDKRDNWDSYDEAWHTSFTGTDVDNDDDGNNDSKWVNFTVYLDGQETLLGAYSIYVVDEASKININLAGNISDDNSTTGTRSDDKHASNQGWTVAEIDLGVLPNIAEALHRNIIQYRYGSNNVPGTDSDNDNDATPMENDGIDNDGDGEIDETGAAYEDDEGDNEPDEYVPGHRFGSDDVKFLTIDQIKAVSGIGKDTFWDIDNKTGIKNLITAHSAYCSQDRCYYNSSWQDRVNINAVESSYTLYNMINNLAGYFAPTGQRYAANIIDYADVDYVPTVCWDYGPPDIPYYGIEGLQINEVMCDVSGIPRENDAGYVSFTGTFTTGAGTDTGINGQVGNWKWPWDDGTYDITIYASTDDPLNATNYEWRFEDGEAGDVFGNATGTVPVNDVQVSGGWVNLRIIDNDEIVPPDPAEYTTSFDKIVIDAGDFVEIINISELSIDIDNNWKIRGNGASSWEYNLPTVTVTLDGHDRDTAPAIFDYLVIANSLYALDYIWGEDDGYWDEDTTPGDGIPDGVWDHGKAMLISSTTSVVDIANAGEALTLYHNNGSYYDVIDVAPASDSYGTVGYAASVTQDRSRERLSPIDDNTAGNWNHSTNTTATGYDCTPGSNNSGASPGASWHVHDGPFANIGLIGDVPKGTGPTTTLDTTDIENFADKFTIVAQRLEGEDATIDGNPLPGTWTLQAGAGIDGTDLYEAPNNSGSWDWVWTDDGDPTTGNFRLFDNTYYLFICADYPDRDFQRPSGTDREVRPNCLAYAGEVKVSGKTFTVTITGNNSDTPRLDYVLLVPRKDSPGRSGRININTALYNSTVGKGILEGLPGIDNTIEGNIVGARPFSEIGGLCDSTGANLTESEFAKISNLITVRSDIFQIICTAVAVKDIDGNASYTEGTDIELAKKKIEVIVDRSPLNVTNGAIKILSWKEITE